MNTAMQELEEKLKDNLKQIVLNADYELIEKLFSEALEKEKEQMLLFANWCRIHDSNNRNEVWMIGQLFDKYNNEKFNQKK